MLVTAVESATLAAVAFDEARERLRLEFCSGAVYLYFGVPAAVHQALLGAPSKGGYFNRAIRGRFPFCRMSECCAGAPDAQVWSGAAGGR